MARVYAPLVAEFWGECNGCKIEDAGSCCQTCRGVVLKLTVDWNRGNTSTNQAWLEMMHGIWVPQINRTTHRKQAA